MKKETIEFSRLNVIYCFLNFVLTKKLSILIIKNEYCYRVAVGEKYALFSQYETTMEN